MGQADDSPRRAPPEGSRRETAGWGQGKEQERPAVREGHPAAGEPDACANLSCEAAGEIHAVRLKRGKAEFLFQRPQSETCVNSLLPHFGVTPCWYARRNQEKRTEI